MNPETGDTLWKGTFLVLMMLILVVGGIGIYPHFARRADLNRRNAILQEKIDAKKREISRLKDYQRRFKTDSDFVEQIARRNRRVFPGELIFIFDKD